MTKLSGFFRDDDDNLSKINILNTEAFTKAYYYGLVNDDFSVAAYLFLQTLPFKSVLSDDIISRFKSHAAVHELPYAYVLWLGSQYYMFENGDKINDVSKITASDYNGYSVKKIQEVYNYKLNSQSSNLSESNKQKDYLTFLKETINDGGYPFYLDNDLSNKIEQNSIGFGVANNLLNEYHNLYYSEKISDGNRLVSEYGKNENKLKLINTGGYSEKVATKTFGLYSVKKITADVLSPVTIQSTNLSTKEDIINLIMGIKNNILIALINGDANELDLLLTSYRLIFLTNSELIKDKIGLEDFDSFYDKIKLEYNTYGNPVNKVNNIDNDLVINLYPSYINPLKANPELINQTSEYQFNFIWSDYFKSAEGDYQSTNAIETNKYIFDGFGKKVFKKRNQNDYELSYKNSDYITEILRAVPLHTLEVCKSEFEKFISPNYSVQSVDTYNFKSLMYALTTLVYDDFSDLLNDDGSVSYTVDEQLRYILLPQSDLQEKIIKKAYRDFNFNELIIHILSNAQENKVNKVIDEFLTPTVGLSVNTVLDYVDTTQMQYYITKSDSIDDINDDFKTILVNYFGGQTGSTQTTITTSDIRKYVISNEELRKYKYSSGYTEFNIVSQLKNVINNNQVLLNKELLIKMVPYLKNAIINNKSTNINLVSGNFDDIINHIVDSVNELTNQKIKTANYYFSKYDNFVSGTTKQQLQAIKARKNNLAIAKFKTYYNVKDIFDRWISFKPGENDMFYMYNNKPDCIDNFKLLSDGKDLIEYFSFVDRSNGDISDRFIVNLKWLNEYFSDNLLLTSSDVVNSTLYKFLEILANEHNFLLHSLPTHVNLGSFKEEEARSMFLAFDELGELDSSPSFIFQYAGDMTSKLDLPSDKTLNDLRQSFCLDNPNNGNESNPTQVPDDLLNGNSVAFVIEYGKPNQEFFKNLEIDQSEFQETEESANILANLIDSKSEVASANLYDFFISRSYTAAITTMGNMSIQPLMYFYLKGVPMYYGTYWITNVAHYIQNNQIETRFSGVRQPISTLPLPEQITMESIDDLLTSTNIIDNDYINNSRNNPESWDENYRIGNFITYADMIASDKARKAGVSNQIPPETETRGLIYTAQEIMTNIEHVIINAYDPLINHLNDLLEKEGKPSRVTSSIISSGYRNTIVNDEIIKGAANSDHKIGAAIDLDIDGRPEFLGTDISNATIFEFFRDDPRFQYINSDGETKYYFNQLLWEYGDDYREYEITGEGKPNWVHIAWKAPLTKNGINKSDIDYVE